MGTGVILSVAAALAGGGFMLAVAMKARRTAPDIEDFLAGVIAPGYEATLAQPFPTRIAGLFVKPVARRLERLLPRKRLEMVDNQLAQAGLSGHRSAGEQLAAQLGLTLLGVLLTVLLLKSGVSGAMRLMALLPPVMGFMYPNAKLQRLIRTRSEAVFKDLPDIIDMLAIAVEAGSGFEAAISIVCENYDSPMSDDLATVLQAMRFGVPRREAFQDLKRRSDLDVVRNFVMALVQADALGIPIGRVLKSQATEIRARRRAWAREKAAKLPVKILFPLVLFIFPPIMALVLGPAAAGFVKIGGS